MIGNISKKIKATVFLLVLCFVLIRIISTAKAQNPKPVVEQPVTVNGDTVEYSTEKKEVTAVGNVSVDYKGTKLRCNKLTVNTQTKDATAEGNVRIEDESGVMLGEKIIYNFNTKKGNLVNAHFVAVPYFGKSETIEKVSENKFVALNGYATTCDLERPHYNLKSRKISVYPKDKIQTKKDTLYIGRIPLMYLPYYNHSLKDPLMHVQLSPGYSKDWGAYLLSAWRYNLTDNINGRIYLDYRDRRGLAGGFGANCNTGKFGRGDVKFYYMQERPRDFKEDQPGEFQRYFVRLRHKWDIDERTNLVNEYYRITDSKRILLGEEYNVLKDYFPREYEIDTQPLSYTLLHHSFNNSSADILVQKRVNRWYTPGQLEKLPEVRYNLPSLQMGESPLYFEDSSSAGNFNYKHAVPSPSSDDINYNRLDSTNKVSLPMRLAFINVTPFAGMHNTVYDKDTNNDAVLRNMFITGADFSTKFYRLFDLKSNFLGMDINGLRHIITPTIGYAYNHRPTVPSSKLKQIPLEAIDALAGSNSATLGLSNKFQTKRNNQSVDFADFSVNSSYNYKPKGGRGSSLGDVLFDLQFLPYSWLRLDSDATYTHSGARSDEGYKHFAGANYDVNFNLAAERSIGIGQRYQRKGANELTFNTDWRISPKWKFRVYERYQFKDTANVRQGLVKQEYTFSRDLHCWLFDLTYTIEKEHGHTIWCVFRLKAFPETEIDFHTSYSRPQSGSQSD